MEYLFFISDTFLWGCLIGLFIWVMVVANNLSKLETTVRNLNRKLENLYGQILQGKDISELRKSVPEQYMAQQNKTQAQVVTPQPKPQAVAPTQSQQPQQQVNRPEAGAIPKQNVNPTTKSVTQTVKPQSNMETVFLGNLFNKIGALAIIIALIIFIKLVSNYIVFTNPMKIAFGFLAGITMFFSGVKLHDRENFKGYSEVLIGTGFASLFITTYCSYFLKVLQPAFATGIGVSLLLAVFVVAHNMKTISALVIGLIGGYLTPYLTGASVDGTFSYLIFLNLVSLVYSSINAKAKWMNTVNLMLTMFILLITCAGLDPTKIVYPLTLWAIYIIYDFVRDKNNQTDNVTCVINYVFLTLTTMLMFKASAQAVGILFGATAMIYALLAFFGKRLGNPIYKRYEHCIFLNVWFSILFTLEDIYSIVTWSVVALMLSFAVKRDRLKTVKHYITFYYLSSILGVFLAKSGSTFMLTETYTPILNVRSLVFLIPSLSMIMSISRLRMKENDICNMLRFGIISLTYTYVMCEIISVINQYQDLLNEISSAAVLKLTAFIIVGFMYSCFLQTISKNTKAVLFSVVGHFLGIISLIMLLIGEISHPMYMLPIVNMRILAYGAALYYCYNYYKLAKADVFKYLAVIVGFVFCSAEGLTFDHLLNTGYMASLSWLLYSGGITLAGLAHKKQYLTNSGIWILILSILRVFIYDLAHVEPIYKIIAFLALGAILMIISYIYLKQKPE